MDAAETSPARAVPAPGRFFPGALNHLLRGNPWALDRLRQFAGKTVRFDIAPLHFSLTILGNGEVAPADPAASPDAAMTATLPLLLRIFGMREPDLGLADISGDAGLVSEMVYLMRHLKWDVEEDLSHFLGDSIAHRLAGTGKQLFGWPGAVLMGFAGSLAEFWTEERPILAPPGETRRFLREVALLAAETESLEKRIEKLEKC